ncbi:hypothetical protein LEP1GSC016_0663 [Leptospira borgpetersenii serovar Hardjo-bovis str. Sponselee]|uniref:Uncharacterized protein n=1 Tax=Leptospira borgpetersenii serovar Hardjo-bovis str. Sponselee TaxID=1303729 RepID=M6BIA1_LEPBO|nr:hypothetical protein LEP1GSC016_0663 [Leptospira borgpetersenii serovar Hardjo-bovis str. Sponselee]
MLASNPRFSSPEGAPFCLFPVRRPNIQKEMKSFSILL